MPKFPAVPVVAVNLIFSTAFTPTSPDASGINCALWAFLKSVAPMLIVVVLLAFAVFVYVAVNVVLVVPICV